MMCRVAGVLFGFAIMMAAVPAHAAPITFTGSSASLSASVTFTHVGDSLIVTLKNTSMSDVMVPNDILTGVFFNVNGDPALTRTSAVLAPLSTVLFGGADPGGVVGGEWAYLNGLNQYSANSGISSSGLGDLFGPTNRFPGTNLQGPNSPNGLEYGLTSQGDNPATGNTPVTGTQALIKNEMVFTLGNWLLGDPTPQISNVTFQYGTSLDQPHFGGNVTITQVPEPSALLLFGAAAGFAARRRFKRVRP